MGRRVHSVGQLKGTALPPPPAGLPTPLLPPIVYGRSLSVTSLLGYTAVPLQCCPAMGKLPPLQIFAGTEPKPSSSKGPLLVILFQFLELRSNLKFLINLLCWGKHPNCKCSKIFSCIRIHIACILKQPHMQPHMCTLRNVQLKNNTAC